MNMYSNNSDLSEEWGLILRKYGRASDYPASRTISYFVQMSELGEYNFTKQFFLNLIDKLPKIQ